MKEIIELKDARIVVESEPDGKVGLTLLINGPNWPRRQVSTVAIQGESWNVMAKVVLTQADATALTGAISMVLTIQ